MLEVIICLRGKPLILYEEQEYGNAKITIAHQDHNIQYCSKIRYSFTASIVLFSGLSSIKKKKQGGKLTWMEIRDTDDAS